MGKERNKEVRKNEKKGETREKAKREVEEGKRNPENCRDESGKGIRGEDEKKVEIRK